jgi:hypothetical protein
MFMFKDMHIYRNSCFVFFFSESFACLFCMVCLAIFASISSSLKLKYNDLTFSEVKKLKSQKLIIVLMEHKLINK